MVVGGYFYDGVEVISPDGSCSLSLAEFPYGTIHLAAGAAMAPGTVWHQVLVDTAYNLTCMDKL